MSHPIQLILVACIVLSPLMCPGARAQTASEYSIKAGYLLLFTRYVEWPDQAFATDNAPIIICVLGADPFGTLLDRTVEGQQSQNRPLHVRRVTSAENARDCHVAFISDQESDHQMEWLAALAGLPILTVCEDADALQDGSVLTFVEEQERGQSRVRFDASFPAIQAADLKVSSQMLVSARKVHRVPGA